MQLPNDVIEATDGKDLSKMTIRVRYKNWKEDVAIRTIIPLSIFHGSNEFHKENQWLLKVWDVEKHDYRTYAIKDILEWFCKE